MKNGKKIEAKYKVGTRVVCKDLSGIQEITGIVPVGENVFYRVVNVNMLNTSYFWEKLIPEKNLSLPDEKEV